MQKLAGPDGDPEIPASRPGAEPKWHCLHNQGLGLGFRVGWGGGGWGFRV